MGITVQHDRPVDQLHLVFRTDRLIVDREWCTSNATIALAADRTPLEVTIYRYYSDPRWEFTEAWVEQYGLREYEDDLRLVWRAFFAPPEYAVKTISYEGPDGEEIIISAGE